MLYLAAILSSLHPDKRKEAISRLGIAGKRAELIMNAPEHSQKVCNKIEQMKTPSNSRIYRLLRELPLELLLFSMAVCSERVRQVISHFITNLLLVTPELTGEDLKKLGFTPGPVYRKILDRLLAARLDHEVRQRHEEIALVLREFGDERK